MIRILGLAAIAALMVAPTAAQATHGNGPGPKHDYTVGGGITGINTHFGYAAQSRPDGTDFGHAVFKNPMTGSETSGHVVCVRTAGIRASFVFEIEQGSIPGGATFRTIFVEDNGEPVNGQPVDNVTGGPVFTSRPTQCPAPINVPGGIRTLLEGNLIVHDSPADS